MPKYKELYVQYVQEKEKRIALEQQQKKLIHRLELEKKEAENTFKKLYSDKIVQAPEGLLIETTTSDGFSELVGEYKIIETYLTLIKGEPFKELPFTE